MAGRPELLHSGKGGEKGQGKTQRSENNQSHGALQARCDELSSQHMDNCLQRLGDIGDNYHFTNHRRLKGQTVKGRSWSVGPTESWGPASWHLRLSL